eukprot:2382441-Amphidinium_carterae.1
MNWDSWGVCVITVPDALEPDSHVLCCWTCIYLQRFVLLRTENLKEKISVLHRTCQMLCNLRRTSAKGRNLRLRDVARFSTSQKHQRNERSWMVLSILHSKVFAISGTKNHSPPRGCSYVALLFHNME